MIIYFQKPNNWQALACLGKKRAKTILKYSLLALGGIFLLFVGVFLQKKLFFHNCKAWLASAAYKPKSFYYQITTRPKTIKIDISFKNFEKIKAKRQEALNLGVLLTTDADFVPANVSYEGKEVPVRIRLKGDWTDQLATEKWAFRVETKGENAIWGMTRFSLHPPQTRNNLNEWLFLEVLKQEGIIALRYDFVDVFVNGEHKGIYALEEHFSKELVENNQRREGPILKLNEEILWEQQVKFGNDANRNYDYYYRALIDPFQWAKIEKREELYQEFLRAEKLLRGYRDLELPPEEVFDYKLWVKFLALSDLFGANHALSWQNLRFYYNPLSDKLEPVPFDSMPGNYPTEILIDQAQPISFPYHQLFRDENFTRLYLSELNYYLQADFISSFLDKNQEKINNYSQILARDSQFQFDPGFLFSNQKYLSSKLTPTTPFLAYIKKNKNTLPTSKLLIEIYNADRVPLKILGVKSQNEERLLSLPIFLETNFENSPIQPQLIDFDLKKDLDKSINLEIVYQFLHQDQKLFRKIEAWPHQDIPAIGKDIENLSGILYDRSRQQYLASGKLIIDTIYKVEKGNLFVFLPGTKIEFVNGGGIISSIPLQIQGQDNNPVSFSSPDKSGFGILVRNTVQESKINYASFEGLANFKTEFWETTGGVTFYQAPVSMTNVSFANFQAEDTLNIVDSYFSLENINLTYASSDGLDTDFAEGKIIQMNCTFTGNDCFDFSGSKIEVKNIKIDSPGDKGVSVGEKSQVTIYGADIKNAKQGFACKDSSHLKIDGSQITHADYGVTVYQKKPEFGPASVEIGFLNPVDIKTLFLIEKTSSVFYNGKRLEGDIENVYQQLSDTSQ